MIIKLISAEQTLPIRFAVLWPHKSIDYCRVDDDEFGEHYGAFINDELVSVASVFTHNRVSRLRKFATLQDYQGQGIGSQLLTAILEDVRQKHCTLFWCDARETAASLYQRFGLEPQGERFYKGEVAYFKMVLSLND
ncbi:GNAT family N-acetyltransferase [Vibrio sinaloensis]|uniref:GNAT family N-acetyltransferase n=1 Tax=Photobacterium sp. (strain ATCC 43367) TaxID=379097 RepID=UPI0035EDD8A9